MNFAHDCEVEGKRQGIRVAGMPRVPGGWERLRAASFKLQAVDPLMETILTLIEI